MSTDPEELRGKAMRGNFDRIEEEEEEEELELDLDFAGPGIANSKMESTAEAARLKVGARKLNAIALSEMTRPTGVRDYASGDDEEDDTPRRPGPPPDDEEDDATLGSLDAPLWNVVAAAPAPPPRPDGFPLPSKWVTTGAPRPHDALPS